MTIVTQCPKCGKRLKAPDQQVGRQARCPQCKTDFTIKALERSLAPAAARPAAAQQPVGASAASSESSASAAAAAVSSPPRPEPTDKPEWYVQTGDGVEYGPVTRADLDVWLAEDRLDKDCQILKDGWDQWKWAEEMFPQLVQTAAPPSAPPAVADEDDPLAGIGDELVTASGGMAVVSGRGGSASSIRRGGSGRIVADPTAETTSRVITAMLQTRPWVTLFAILAFLVAASAALGIVGAVLVMIAAPLAGLGLLLAIGTYVGVYGYLGLLLLKYANGCSQVARSRSQVELEKTLEAQRDFWKFAGILVLVVIGVSIVGGLTAALLLRSMAIALPPH